MKRTNQVLLLLVVVAAAITAISSYSNAVGGGGGPLVCPDIYAPVICDNGRIYPNQCWADHHHAHNCVPYGTP